MSNAWDLNYWDVARVFIFTMFGLGFGEAVGILKAYGKVLKKTRRLLPRHVVGVSLSLLGLQCVAVWQTFDGVGDGFTPFILINGFLMTLAWWSLRDVRLHLTRKADIQQEILPLIAEPKEFG